MHDGGFLGWAETDDGGEKDGASTRVDFWMVGGIIDILQPYTTPKSAESIVKQINVFMASMFKPENWEDFSDNMVYQFFLELGANSNKNSAASDDPIAGEVRRPVQQIRSLLLPPTGYGKL